MASERGGGAQEYGRSNVTRLLNQLRGDILALPEDAFLGVEDDLLQRYATSRPTLRQAMRVLEHEKLVAVKRGFAGGYYGRRPDAEDLVAAAAAALQMQGCTMTQAMEAIRAVGRRAAHAAAESTDEVARRELRELIDAYEAADYPSRPTPEFLRAERQVSDAIYRLAGNPALSFFGAVIHQFGTTLPDMNTYGGRPDRVALRVKRCVQRVRAILDGDTLIVDALGVREDEVLSAWFAEDSEAAAREPRRPRPSPARGRRT